MEDPQGVEELAEEKHHVVNSSDLITGVLLVEIEEVFKVEVGTLEVDTTEEVVLEAEVHLTVEGATRKAGGLEARRIMAPNIEAAMVLIVKDTASVLQAAGVVVMVVVQHQIPLLSVHPAAMAKDSQTSDKEVSVVLEDMARVEVMALEVEAATTREVEVAVAIAKVEEVVAVATTREEEVVVAIAKAEEVVVAAIAREAQVAITKVAVEAVVTAKVLEAAVATVKEVVATAKVQLEVATAKVGLEVATAVRATVTTVKAMVKDITNLRPRALPPLRRHTVRVATINSTSSHMEISNGASIRALGRHQIQIRANHQVKVSGASGTTEQAAAVTTSPGDTEGPRETPEM